MERNFNGIQFEKLRKQIDGKFNIVHDELSDCYYNKKPFRNYGILTKEQFDKLHGLIFLKRDVEFHEENLKQPAQDIIPEAEYNEIKNNDGELVTKVNEQSQSKINALKQEGFELVI